MNTHPWEPFQVQLDGVVAAEPDNPNLQVDDEDCGVSSATFGGEGGDIQLQCVGHPAVEHPESLSVRSRQALPESLAGSSLSQYHKRRRESSTPPSVHPLNVPGPQHSTQWSSNRPIQTAASSSEFPSPDSKRVCPFQGCSKEYKAQGRAGNNVTRSLCTHIEKHHSDILSLYADADGLGDEIRFWGCGFCDSTFCHINSKLDLCDHISLTHNATQGLAEWSFSTVILSLLGQCDKTKQAVNGMLQEYIEGDSMCLAFSPSLASMELVRRLQSGVVSSDMPGEIITAIKNCQPQVKVPLHFCQRLLP
jgi:hypothetical protein